MKHVFLFFVSLVTLPCALKANGTLEEKKEPMTHSFAEAPSTLVTLQYDNEELVNIVNYIASKKEINILLPTKTDDKLTGKLTWHLDKKVSLDQAWQLLQTILNIAGYAVIPRSAYYEIVKVSPAISKEPVPLYVGVPFESLPFGNERVRYIYYLSNIKQDTESEGELPSLLKAVLPTDAIFKIDIATNALIIIGQSNDIRSAMSIVTQLDRPGFQERMEIIKLRYTEARMVADLFNNKILQAGELNRYRLDTKKPSEATYFSKFVKIIANEKTNTLIVLGRTQALERIREFISHYIDVEPDSGKSILHVYQLLYLDAGSFAKVLEGIVKSKQSGGLEQSTGDQKAATGPQRYFDEVIIAVDTPPEGSNDSFVTNTGVFGDEGGDSNKNVQANKYYGSNKLIIAARNDDWKRIRELIEVLDKPSPQVLIEVLIADLTLDDIRSLGSAFRNPAKIPMPGEVNFQSAQLSPGVMPDSFSNPQTIGAIAGGAASDLLREFTINQQNQQRTDGGTQNIANLLQAGSSVIAFSDSTGKTWGITEILKLFDNKKILSHPHVISTNNQVATIEVTEIRLLADQASGSQGGTLMRTNKDIPAALKVYITPRISISEMRTNTVSLNVTIDINEYKSATDNTRITRKVKTNSIVNNGEILALGGLLRTNESSSVGETPVLSQIPVVGWLFKKRGRTEQRTNLTVFISPTIIMPRSREALGEYTKDYLNITKNYAGVGVGDALKDPITRWFFNEESPTKKFTKDFLKEDEILSKKIPMPSSSTHKYNQPSKTPAQNGNSAIITQQQEKMLQLKDLLKDTDDAPFKNLIAPVLAHNTADLTAHK